MLLETGRVVLRKFRETDFSDFCDYAMDPKRCRMMGTDELPDIDAARMAFDWFLTKEDRAYAIVHKQSGKVIGGLTVYNTPPSHIVSLEALKGKRGAALSFGIAKAFRRQGLMLEAVSAVIAHLFEVEGVDYINAGYLYFNTPSRQMQKKLGFSYLTTARFGEGEETVTVIENILWNGHNSFSQLQCR